MYSQCTSKYEEVNEVSKQIAISDELYDQLNDLRKHKGRKYSFNTVINGLLREALLATTDQALFQKLQWHALTKAIRKLDDEGWVSIFRLQDAHILRMCVNDQYQEAIDYIRDQLPVSQSDVSHAIQQS